MKEKIKKYIGEIFLLIGAFAVIYNIMNFNSDRGCGILLDLDIGEECNNPVEYFYGEDTRLMAGLGLVLFITGTLVIRRRNRKYGE